MRHVLVFGGEDLRRAATRDCMPSDQPADVDHIIFNDKQNLPYCLREGHTEKRPVHNYWQSDRMWAVMYDEPYIKLLRGEGQQPGQAEQHRPDAHEPPSYSDDESADWKNVPRSRSSKHKRRSSSEDCARRFASERRRREGTAPALCERCQAHAAFPPSGLRRSGSSMSSPSVQRCDVSRGSMRAQSPNASAATPGWSSPTPRRSPAPDASGWKASPSDSISRLEAACPSRPRPKTPGIDVRRGGDATPCSFTSQSTTPSSTASLSMTHLVVSRRDSALRGATPRRSTPRTSVRKMSKEEVAGNR